MLDISLIQNNKFKLVKAKIHTIKSIPLKRPFCDGTYVPHLDLPIYNWLELYDGDGNYGCTPCSSIMKNTILPLVLNNTEKSYNEIYNKVFWNVRNSGFNGETYTELGRLDLALYDIMAKRQNLPLHKFLGAKKDFANVYASGCGTNLCEKDLVNEAEKYVSHGYSVIKMKIAKEHGTMIDNDIERIKLLREAVGNDIKITIDANQCWNSNQALIFIEKAFKYNIYWFEEPVLSCDFTEIEKICTTSPVNIAMGESLKNSFMFDAYAKNGVAHLQPVWSNMGGIGEVIKTCNIASDNKLSLSLGGYTHITAAISAACPDETLTEYLEPLFYQFGEIMSIKPEEKNGRFYLPDVAGLPVKLDTDLLEKTGYLINTEYFYV